MVARGDYQLRIVLESRIVVGAGREGILEYQAWWQRRAVITFAEVSSTYRDNIRGASGSAGRWSLVLSIKFGVSKIVVLGAGGDADGTVDVWRLDRKW